MIPMPSAAGHRLAAISNIRMAAEQWMMNFFTSLLLWGSLPPAGWSQGIYHAVTIERNRPLEREDARTAGWGFPPSGKPPTQPNPPPPPPRPRPASSPPAHAPSPEKREGAQHDTRTPTSQCHGASRHGVRRRGGEGRVPLSEGPVMPERPLPTEKEVRALIRGRRNWGRWGKDYQIGALNLIKPARRAAAARLVRTGRSVSLSRPFPKEPGPNNALPAHHCMRTLPRGTGGFAADYYGIFYHGIASTHIDALCHTWDDEAMWNGRDPKKEITFDGATFGSVEHWAEGIITRGVLLDVPRHRGVPSVTLERPVHG